MAGRRGGGGAGDIHIQFKVLVPHGVQSRLLYRGLLERGGVVAHDILHVHKDEGCKRNTKGSRQPASGPQNLHLSSDILGRIARPELGDCLCAMMQRTDTSTDETRLMICTRLLSKPRTATLAGMTPMYANGSLVPPISLAASPSPFFTAEPDLRAGFEGVETVRVQERHELHTHDQAKCAHVTACISTQKKNLRPVYVHAGERIRICATPSATRAPKADVSRGVDHNSRSQRTLDDVSGRLSGVERWVRRLLLHHFDELLGRELQGLSSW